MRAIPAQREERQKDIERERERERIGTSGGDEHPAAEGEEQEGIKSHVFAEAGPHS